jgi:tetratricopeptide (TPR) repeat protein
VDLLLMESRSNKLYILVIYLVLAAVTLVGFEQARLNEFVSYDDPVNVTDNRHVQGPITRESFVWAFTTSHGGNWHPLTWLSHMLDCALFGLNPGGHHLVNVLFHIASTLVLFWILKRMTRAVWASAFVAALFAVHPLHVESVAWVGERKDVLSGFFWMLTIAAYVHYSWRRGIGRYLPVIIAFAGGLMAKSMLVTLPFVLLLLDFWPLGRFRRADREAPALLLIIEKIPLFVLSGVSSVVTFIVQQRAGAMALSKIVPLRFCMANVPISYISYILKTFYPARLAVLYPHPGEAISVLQAVICLVILAAATAVVIHVVWRRGRYPWLAVGWLWYLITLVPVIGVVQIGAHAMADRYTYLPLTGIFIIVAFGVSELSAKWRYREVILAVSACVVVGALVMCTRRQVGYWRNDLALFGHAVEVTERNDIMHDNYGGALFQNGKVYEAMEHFNETLRINPNRHTAHNNLARALQLLGKEEQAMSHYRRAVEIEPDFAGGHYNLAGALESQGKEDEATFHYREVLRIEPEHGGAHYSLGIAAAQSGQPAEAIEHFRKSLEVKPDWSWTYYNLGVLYYEQGEFDKAVDHINRALRLKPDYLEAKITLANMLFELGRIQSCLRQYYSILELEPGHVDILNKLAWILATTKEFCNAADAVGFAQRACEITNYSEPSLLDTLAAAYAAGGKFGKAVETGEKAVRLADLAGKRDLADHILYRLSLYRDRKPYRQASTRQDKPGP